MLPSNWAGEAKGKNPTHRNFNDEDVQLASVNVSMAPFT